MKSSVLAAALIVAPAFAAVAQAGSDAGPDAGIIWRGDFESGASSLSGNCDLGENQWCSDQTINSQQLQVVEDPVVQGKYALRVQVQFGDVYPGMSDSRSLMSGPWTLWEDEGSERWYRWQAMWPAGYVGSYPKWDQLDDPSATSNGGSIVEWHQDANGAVETGSAPLYIGASQDYIYLCLVNQATSECQLNLNLAPLLRGSWHDFVVHALWSSDATIGFLEIWIDGVNVMPKQYVANKYPGMRNYLIAGLYRNGEIGDPTLQYPDGGFVYGSDGTPGVVYLDGFLDGTTQASVLSGDTLLTAASDGGAVSGDGGAVSGDGGAVSGDGGAVSGDGGSVASGGGADAGAAASGDAGSSSGSSGGAGGSDAGAVAVADAGSGNPTAAIAASSLGGGGCSTGGAPLAWLGVACAAALLWRRRKSAA